MRHCLTDEGPQMQTDRGLDKIGKRQAKIMRKFTKKANVNFDLIITSDFKRTLETAEKMQRKGVQLVTDADLRPNGKPDKAWASILAKVQLLNRDREEPIKSVLIVTHGPLIEKLFAEVAFHIDAGIQWEHGAMGYVNGGDSEGHSNFRWFVSPKLAAHIVGKNPKKVENTLLQAQVKLGENLMRAEKARVVEPLIRELTAQLKRRFRLQLTWYRAQAEKGAPLETIHFRRAFDDVQHSDFAVAYQRIVQKAYQDGAQHVAESIQGLREATAEEEAKLKQQQLVKALPDYDRDADDLEDEIDQTTDDEVSNVVKGGFAKDLAVAGVIALVASKFADYEEDRADTIATNEVSTAFHGGGADLIDAAEGDFEKSWDTEDDPCPICEDNGDQGYISSDDSFDSGDDEPPAHPNCRCSVSYRRAES